MDPFKDRLFIVTGHYGSGKSEFSLNLALRFQQEGRACDLVDLDIVNPYFRSREMRGVLEAAGIRVIASSTADGADIPALSPAIAGVFTASGRTAVIDMGGDPVGARVLSRYAHQIDRDGLQMWMTVNANRPQTATPEKVIDFIHRIQGVARCNINGLVNNTHLTDQTTVEDILHGNALCLQVSEQTGIPLVCNAVERRLVDQLPPGLAGEIFPIDIHLKKPWES